MALFVTSTPNRHGAFAIEVPPPSSIAAAGTGQACIVEQFPWGPGQSIYTPVSMGDFFNTFAPRGFSRLGSGHLSVIRKSWPLPIKGLRVLGSAATTASIAINKTGPTLILTVNLKFPGAAGNSVTATTSAADDGNANHFNLTVTITGASGTTTDIVRNINISGVGANVLPDTTNAILIAPPGGATPGLQFVTTGTPIIGGFTASGGADGTIAATQYVGTPGGNDFGFAKLEGDQNIDFFFVGDPTAGLRPAVQSGGTAHANLMTDRIFVTNGVSGQTASAAQGDAPTYASQYVVYVDPWANIFDDTTGAVQLVPSACWAASVACQLPPSTSIGWKNTTVTQMLAGIASLEFNRGSATGINTAAGISTLIQARNGGFAFEAGKLTDTTPGVTNLTRRRTGIFIAKSFTASVQGFVDAPNVPTNQQDIINALDNFLGTLKSNQNRNPNLTAHILDYKIWDIATANTNATLAGGDFYVPADVKVSSAMERIWLSMRFGETVTIQAA